MPIYEFKCPHCGWSGEVYSAMGKEIERERCPTCGQEMVKQLSVPAPPRIK